MKRSRNPKLARTGKLAFSSKASRGRGLRIEVLEQRAVLSGSPPTAVMLGEEFTMPSWLSADQMEAVQESAAAITDTGTASSFPIQTMTSQSYSTIGLSYFAPNPSLAAFDGSGTSIVVIDSGINTTHPLFAGRIVYQQDFAEGDMDATDFGGHGTNVAGIAAGAATGADIIVLKVFKDVGGSGNYGYVKSALQWVISNAATYNIASVNMSLGNQANHASDYNEPLANIYQELATIDAMNVAVVVAAGNAYHTYNSPGVGYPAADPSVISVGATYDSSFGQQGAAPNAIAYTTGVDRLTAFSQRSTTMVDIFAPGSAITSAGLGGTPLNPSPTSTYHGTSQATPHIAAVAAIAQQINQEVRGTRLTRVELIDLLKRTGNSIYDGDDENDNVVNTYTSYKRVNAVVMAMGLLPPKVNDVRIDGTSWAWNGNYSLSQRTSAGELLRPIYTQAANQVSVQFSEHVQKRSTAGTISNIASNITDGNLLLELVQTVRHSNGSVTTSTVSATGFTYDSWTNLATWTFSSLDDGKYAIHLKSAGPGVAGIVDVDGNALDGDWSYNSDDYGGTLDDFSDDLPKAFKVGNNTAGSFNNEFRIHFALLAGDYDGNGVVNAGDALAMADGNGDGVITTTPGGADDLVRSANINDLLPLRAVGGADFHDDDFVDAVDLAIWSNGFGGSTSGDANGDGIVDGADFLAWQRLYLSSSAWYVGPPLLAPASIGVLPRVSNVIISGSASLHSPYSYDTVDGSGNQLKSVPVGGADTISIVFSEDVNVPVESLYLVGLQTATMPQVAEFSYNPLTFTATWRFDDWSVADQYSIVISQAVTDVDGNWLDGEWVNPTSVTTVNSLVSEFPSGDGNAGGNFAFVVTLLPGDANQDNLVNIADFSLLSSHYNLPSGQTYSTGDFNGDGGVSVADFGLLSVNYNTDLRDVFLLADLDSNGIIDYADIAIINLNGNMTGAAWSDGDLNGDGVVDQDDLDMAFSQLGLGLSFVS